MPALQHEPSASRRGNTSRPSNLSQLLIVAALVASSGALTVAPACAEPGYPRQPVTIYVPYGAAGPAALAREPSRRRRWRRRQGCTGQPARRLFAVLLR